MNVVAHIPSAPNTRPITVAAGTARTAHQDGTRPVATVMPRNIAEYSDPRSSDQTISPTAMSRGRIGVASMASYRWANRILK